PERYAERQAFMYRQIETVRHLWRGGTVRERNSAGREVEIRVYPSPVRPDRRQRADPPDRPGPDGARRQDRALPRGPRSGGAQPPRRQGHPDAPHLPGRRRRAGARHRPRSVPRVPAVGRQPGGEVGDRRRRDQRRPQGRVPPDLRAGDGGPAGRHLRALRPHRSADGHAGAARAVRAPPRRDRRGRDRLPDRFRGGRGPRPGRPRAPRRPARPLLRRDQSRPDRVRARRIPGGPRRVTITLDRSKTVPVPVDAVAADAGIRPLQGPLPGEDVLDLFDRVCRAHARDVAVEWRGRAVSYRELDRLSRRLACRLRAEGLGEGDVAVLWLEDRVLWIAALLACLRSGCAFAPIDPDWPE